MWFKNWFMGKKAIVRTPTQEPEVDAAAQSQEINELTRLTLILRDADVDSIVADPALKRMMFTSYSTDVTYLIEALYSSARLPSITCAVSLHDYFHRTKLPPSVCLERILSQISVKEIRANAKHDLVNLLEALESCWTLSQK